MNRSAKNKVSSEMRGQWVRRTGTTEAVSCNGKACIIRRWFSFLAKDSAAKVEMFFNGLYGAVVCPCDYFNPSREPAQLFVHVVQKSLVLRSFSSFCFSGDSIRHLGSGPCGLHGVERKEGEEAGRMLLYQI